VGLYRQPNDYTCGPFALKHALVTLGRLANEESINQVAHPHWWAGTDEVKLARAARHFGCDLPLVRKKDPDRAHGALCRFVAKDLPVILCVDDWGHWITVVRREADRFVVLDSKYDPVLNVLSWPQLRNRWNYVEYDDKEDGESLYDMHPLVPRFRVSVKAQFSVQRAQFLRRPENLDLAKNWDDYLEDMLEICRPRTARSNRILSMAEFLRRNQDLLVSRLIYWHGSVQRDEILRLLRNFRFVAETYALCIPAQNARRALTDVSMLLAMWAAGHRGITPLYSDDEA
jgi:hypothetical protein